VEQVFAGVSSFVANPSDYIWNVILRGIRARFADLIDALLSEEKK
jgi:hypothetical protein